MNETGEKRWELTLIEKIVAACIIGLLGWQTFTTQQMSVDLAVVKSQLQNATGDRFTAQEGRRLEDRISRNEERIKALEQHEKDAAK